MGAVYQLANISSLTSFDGLSGLNSVGGGLTIEDNPLVTNIVALSLSVFDFESIEVGNNDSLTSLAGLESPTGGWWRLGYLGDHHYRASVVLSRWKLLALHHNMAEQYTQ